VCDKSEEIVEVEQVQPQKETGQELEPAFATNEHSVVQSEELVEESQEKILQIEETKKKEDVVAEKGERKVQPGSKRHGTGKRKMSRILKRRDRPQRGLTIFEANRHNGH
jgi:hypothetical protein